MKTKRLACGASILAFLVLGAPALADEGLGLTDPRAGDGDYEPRPLFNIPPQDGLGIGDPMAGQGDYQPRPLIRAVASPAPAKPSSAHR